MFFLPAESFGPQIPDGSRDIKEESLQNNEKRQNISIRHLTDQGAKGNGKTTEQQTPSPLSTTQWLGVESFAAFKDDEELAQEGQKLHANKPRIGENPLMPDIDPIIDSATVVLVEKLHEDVDVEHKRLQLIDLGLSSRVEDVPTNVVHQKYDQKLIDGLAKNHLPHGDAHNAFIARLRFAHQGF